MSQLTREHLIKLREWCSQPDGYADRMRYCDSSFDRCNGNNVTWVTARFIANMEKCVYYSINYCLQGILNLTKKDHNLELWIMVAIGDSDTILGGRLSTPFLFLSHSRKERCRSFQNVRLFLWHAILPWTSRLTVMFMEPSTFTAVQTYVPASSGMALSMYKLPSLLRNFPPFSWTCLEEKLLLSLWNIEIICVRYCMYLKVKYLSYRFSILGPVSFWKRYSIQKHAGNTQGLTNACGDDWGPLGQERWLCRNKKFKDINNKQEEENTKGHSFRVAATWFMKCMIMEPEQAYPAQWHWLLPQFWWFQTGS